MEDDKKCAALFGIGPFEKSLLRCLSGQFDIVAVDMNEGMLKELSAEFPDVHCVAGDASSILTWKRLPAGLMQVISAIHDQDVNVELCRIVREVRKLDIPITIIAPAGQRDAQRLQKFDACIMSPADIGLQAIANRLTKHYTLAGDIGLGKGELIEVPILARSHLVGKTLNMLRPAKWHVAGIYRDNQLLIPRGGTQIRLKDRILLFGDPVVVDNIAGRLLRGNPLFPLQFGSQLVIMQHQSLVPHIEELHYLSGNINVQKAVYCSAGAGDKKAPALPAGMLQKLQLEAAEVPVHDLFIRDEGIGLFFMPHSSQGWLARRRLPLLMKSSRKPLFLSRCSFPYEAIVVSLNCPEPAAALEIGIDLARLFKVPLLALHALMPALLRSAEEELLLKERLSLIADFEHIHKMKIAFSLLEGNPVTATLLELQKQGRCLAVLQYGCAGISSFFRPHVQLHIARKTGHSVLLVPVEARYES